VEVIVDACPEPTGALSVLFVCMGNICRSPTAEGVFRHLVGEAGLEHKVFVDSAGTHDYHVGSPPDARAQAAARKRGYDLSNLRGRQFGFDDCLRFDYVIAMDRGNYNRILSQCSAGAGGNVRLLMEFAPGRKEHEVPDPYGGGEQGFEYVLDLIEEASRGLLEDVVRRLGSVGAA
jgi:protein-tyrosine phosphatase